MNCFDTDTILLKAVADEEKKVINMPIVLNCKIRNGIPKMIL